jgi:hypothetical protein
MSGVVHKIFIAVLSLIVALTFAILAYYGFQYYNSSLEERFYQPGHEILKPSGTVGHGLGIAGSLLIIIGVTTYMARKRYRWMMRIGKLSHWLEFHIFLCTLGPIMILYHTAFKFGGLVAVSFWSMVAVFLSGVIGRFIYLQIPRTIEGRELSLSEVKEMKGDLGAILTKEYNLDEKSLHEITEVTKRTPGVIQSNLFARYFKNQAENLKAVKRTRMILQGISISQNDSGKIMVLVKNEIALNRRIDRLQTMQNLFKYWHVAHLPFAFVMLIIMVIHVIVTIVFGYRWIF